MRIPVVCKLHGHPYHGICQKVPAYFCMPPRALGHQHTGPIRPYGSPDAIYSRSVQYKVSVTKIEADDIMGRRCKTNGNARLPILAVRYQAGAFGQGHMMAEVLETFAGRCGCTAS